MTTASYGHTININTRVSHLLAKIHAPTHLVTSIMMFGIIQCLIPDQVDSSTPSLLSPYLYQMLLTRPISNGFSINASITTASNASTSFNGDSTTLLISPAQWPLKGG